MSRVLYFDPFNGVSGDMILGALIDLGLPLTHLTKELDKLSLDGYELRAEKVIRQSLEGTNFRVLTAGGSDAGHSSDHHHSHAPARGFTAIRSLIEAGQLDSWVSERAVAIFQRLAEAEAKVHGTSVEEVHFHEVGAVDSIVDIVGACIGFHFFEVETFFSTPLNLGGGSVTFSHGTWPVPTPATVELVSGFPVLVGGNAGELTTPTGAAIVTTLANEVEALSICRLERAGLGAGDREIEHIPNMLRLLLGRSSPDRLSQESALAGSQRWQQEEVILLEANLDDTDAETLGHLLEITLERGALDAFCTPVQMKKSRPGVQLSILCRQQDKEMMAGMMFRETTTLGVRWTAWNRWVLEREVRNIQTQFGMIKVKMISEDGQVVRMSPEYEDLKLIAAGRDLPLRTVREKVMEELLKTSHE